MHCLRLERRCRQPYARIGFTAAALAVMLLQAIMTSFHVSLTSSLDTSHVFYDPVSFETSNKPHNDERIPIGDRIPSTHKAFGACLMVKDDNDLLYEWLAYHYTMLPLGFVVVGSDLGNSQDPSSILELWKGFELTTWLLQPIEFIDRHGNYSETFGETNQNDLSVKDQTMHHHHALIHRQKGFITTCAELLKAHGVGWTVLIDTDEFLTLNPWTPKEEEEAMKLTLDHNDEQSIAIQGRKMIANATTQNTSFWDVIESLKRHDPEGMSKCYTIPRLLVGALENETCPGVETTIDFAKSLVNGRFSALSTLRFFQHARKGDFGLSKFGKVLIDLSAIEAETVSLQVPANIHRPFRQFCKSAGGVKFANAYFFLLHYIGSWERYVARSDHRRSRVAWEKRSTVNDDTSACAADMTRWFPKFTKRVGESAAKYLLGVTPKRRDLETLNPF